MLYMPTASAHWYDVAGNPVFEVENKSKGGMRSTNLADARKMGLFPSVTTILSVIGKPQLENWKIRQAILAALTLPRVENESDDDFARRVVQDAQEESKAAKDLGSRVHWGVEAWIQGKSFDDPEVTPFVETYIKWHKANVTEVIACEHRFCHSGYAGTADLVAIVNGYTAVIDVKTQSGKPRYPLKAWEGYGEQLAAYADGVEWRVTKLANVIIDKNNPGRLEVVEHENRQQLRETFHAAFAIWQNRNNYDAPNIWRKLNMRKESV